MPPSPAWGRSFMFYPSQGVPQGFKNHAGVGPKKDAAARANAIIW
tara:strand:- start:5209 stop:5343 length:135 start_codon:yes stop_codon:yes gene_type:complete